MKQYIDKAAVVAEIKKKLDKHSKLQSFNYGAVKDLESLLNFLDTLEVKEVDLEKEVHKFIDKEELHLRLWDVDRIAKHFFELGLKAQKA